MKYETIRRYYHTLSCLKKKQFLYRFLYTVKRKSTQFKSIDCQLRQPMSNFEFPSNQFFGRFDEDKIILLGESIDIKAINIWNHPERSKIFLYNLHYFDAINASKDIPKRVIFNQLIQRWIDENPVGVGNGWEPYPLSLRIVNWIKYFMRFPDLVHCDWRSSLVNQVQSLTEQLEFHLLANHLFVNAKALIFSGVYFDGTMAQRWLFKGLRIIDKEILEQFLLDGGHFERSPMYHALLLWDMCDLYYLAKNTNISMLQDRMEHWGKVIQRGINWMEAMIHPDGEISFFNDATFHIAPTFDAIKAYTLQLGLVSTTKCLSVTCLNKTGYCIVSKKDVFKAILDVGEVGPDYQPGHAHADTLSFEFSLYGQRMIVNSGISEYGQGQMRHYQRSTKAHSTVCINDLDSSDVWSGFRVGYRARPFDLLIQEDTSQIKVSCSHDGYLRCPGKYIHRRTWYFKDNTLSIHDEINGHFKTAVARYYLHPSIQLIEKFPFKLVCRLPTQKIVTIFAQGALSLNVSEAYWYPGFGEKQKNYCIEINFAQNELITLIEW